ncbi:MAG: D-alanine--D-alanine ligase [Solobacterium sp.]|nr:D-alanine--D-alanine ligase [Solobacterium sp.]
MKLNVAVLFGGESVEHEISIISAHQAIAALDTEKYNVIPIYIAKDRRLYVSDELRELKSFTDLNGLISRSTQITLVSTNNTVEIKPVKTSMFGKKTLGTVDVVIPVMHGTNGEDGTIQGFLEMLKVPYAGCDVISAAVGQDKVLQKLILSASGLPITNWFWVYASEMDEHRDEILRKVRKLIYPVIIKPACTGSSIGISIAHNDDEYLQAFAEAAQYDTKIITEKVVKPMREINCSVLGDSFHAMASVLEEVGKDNNEELLTFNKKYVSGGKSSKTASQGMASTARLVPAPLDDAITKEIRDLALKVFSVLGASGVCRIDFMMDAETKTVYVNEINTIPGSLAYYLWAESGISFPELMDRLVELALDRSRRRSRMVFSYDTNVLEAYQEGNGTKK